MSGYRGRTGPNFSQYLSDLNTVSPPDYSFTAPDENDFSQDLAMFTNTDFTNIDMPSLPEDGAFNFDLSTDAPGQSDLKYEDLLASAGPATDFTNAGRVDNQSPVQQAQFFPTYNPPIQPAPTQGFSPVDNTTRRATNNNNNNNNNKKAKSDAPVEDEMSTDDKVRLAAEEDKRRRNTAASARFRVKKKQREQALEKTLKDTQDKNSKLESRISQLEMENKWLKDLITEKNGLSSKEEMAAAYQKYRKESEERDLKAEPSRVSGVGTD